MAVGIIFYKFFAKLVNMTAVRAIRLTTVDGSSCLQRALCCRFENNTAHSFGWFGLWIFEDMYPHQGGSCDSSTPTEVSVPLG